MSITLMTAAFRADLPTTPKFVLVALCDSANDQGECYPSVPVLMSKCSLSDRGVQKAISDLEAGGYLRREFRNGRSTVYWMTPERGSPRPRTTFTPERRSPPNHVHPTPERGSPPPPNHVHPTPEPRSPITVIEPSVEPKKRGREGGAGKGSRLPSDWAPSAADAAYAAEKGVCAESEAENFRDYWLADTTAKAFKADWAAAWRTWCRNAVRFRAERRIQPADRTSRQLETAALMTGAARARPQPETIDVDARVLPA